MFAVPVILTAPVVWLLQTDAGPRFNAKSKSPTSISGEMLFTQKPLRVAYRLQLLDATGHPVVNYPEKVSKGVPRFDNVMLSVPDSLRPGEYHLVARVEYALNPIRGGSSTVQVASISVN